MKNIIVFLIEHSIFLDTLDCIINKLDDSID